MISAPFRKSNGTVLQTYKSNDKSVVAKSPTHRRSNAFGSFSFLNRSYAIIQTKPSSPFIQEQQNPACDEKKRWKFTSLVQREATIPTKTPPEAPMIIDFAPRVPSKFEDLITVQFLRQRGVDADFTNDLQEHYQRVFTDCMLQFGDGDSNNNNKECSVLEMAIQCATEQAKDLVFSAQYLVEEYRDFDRFSVLKELLQKAQMVFEAKVEPHLMYTVATISTNNDESDDAILARDMAKVADWIDRYFGQVQVLGGTILLPPNTVWKQHADDLVDRYIKVGVVKVLKANLERMSLQVDANEYSTSDGKLVSGFQGDVPFFINLQISTARQVLPGRHLEKVVTACNQIFQTAVEQRMLDLGMLWRDMTDKTLCSIVNDSVALSYSIEERNEKYLTSAKDKTTGDSLCRDLNHLALFATKQLCERIMLDVEEANQNESFDVECTNCTLTDYFGDLQVWLHAEYFPKVLACCFDLSLERYLVSFFGTSLAGKTTSASMTASIMRRDYDSLASYWCSGLPSEHYGESGFYNQTTILQRLSLILDLQMILNPELASEDVREQMETVLIQLGSEIGSVAILHVVGLRGKQDASTSMQWHITLSKAKKSVLARTGNAKLGYHYSLPDIRNSRYFTNVQLPRGLEWVEEELDICKSTVLARGRGLQRARQQIGLSGRALQRTIKAGAQTARGLVAKEISIN